jgi:hypothetical protein
VTESLGTVVNTVELFAASPTGGRVIDAVASVTGKQVPLLHVPPKQLWPQAPQLLPSLDRVAHALGQTLFPAAQAVQTPPTQAAPETHWLLLVQLVSQAVAPHTNCPQLWVVAVGQLPAPLQLTAKVSVPPEQLAVPQLVDEPGKTQAVELPLQELAQLPEPEQLPWPLRGVPDTVAQVPGLLPALVSLHPWQVPPQALLQQTVSTQKVLVHWSLALQLWPVPRLGMQAPLRHSPLTQSPSAVQVDALHAVPDAQATPPGQAPGAGTEQAPAPLQLPEVVSCPPLHEGVPQLTVETANRHPPFPSQVPSCPHAVESTVQLPADGPPAATGLQTPVAQVMQTPVQVVAQQTPEMQVPWVH